MRTMGSHSIDLILTDPPYGIRYNSKRQDYFDKMQRDDFVPIHWLKQAFRILKVGAAAYVFCHWKTYPFLVKAASDAGFIVKDLIVVYKTNHGMGDLKSYAPQYELLLFLTKYEHEIDFTMTGRVSNVWFLSVLYSRSKRNHSTEKPFSWWKKPILFSSAVGDTILDPFCGAGSCGLTAQKLHRKFVGIEIDPKYASIAKNRLGI